jgi:hypothetical protein
MFCETRVSRAVVDGECQGTPWEELGRDTASESKGTQREAEPTTCCLATDEHAGSGMSSTCNRLITTWKTYTSATSHAKLVVAYMGHKEDDPSFLQEDPSPQIVQAKEIQLIHKSRQICGPESG